MSFYYEKSAYRVKPSTHTKNYISKIRERLEIVFFVVLKVDDTKMKKIKWMKMSELYWY